MQDDRPGLAGTALRRPTCPKCGGSVDRIPRRWLDRLTSLLLPSRRYRCWSATCRWEGKLRNSRHTLPAQNGERRYDRRIDPP